MDDEQAKIRGNEFVAAAAGVELPAERTEFLDERLFDKMMNVFGACSDFLKPCGIFFGALGNLVEGGERLLHFGGRKNANGFEGLGPGSVHGNFVRQEALVERKRPLERVELSIGLTLEAPSP